MSHFTVLVHIPAEKAVSQIDLQSIISDMLSPYHEFESTGRKDQFVIEVDETDEQYENYRSSTVDSVFKDNVLIGTKYCDSCKHFWQRNGIGFSRNDEFIVPSEYEVRNVHLTEIYTFEEYLKEWCGNSLNGVYSDLRDGRFYRYTNPNAKWDWWTVGGRWDGFFKTTTGEEVNQTIRGNWDINGECINAVVNFSKYYDKFSENISLFENLTYKTWTEVTEDCTVDGKVDYELARQIYHSQEYKSVLKSVFSTEDEKLTWMLHNPETFYNVSRDQFITDRIISEIGTFAVLDQHGWHERGSMGWFASVSDENPNWNGIYLDKIKNMNNNDVLVIVDCHI